MPTNFDLAPPAKDVDGLHAVPIDIQQIHARLEFDASTQTGAGDATLEFVMGPEAGCPIFDLRQTITEVWLDGTPQGPASAGLHDFGGGAGAELRVLSSPLAANSAHTLRVAYTLGPPQASTAGSYQPGLTFSPGPRVRFNFGFTDLGPGRYLEAWIPANLIFDQFGMDLELRLTGTAVAHSVITNGALTTLGANHWSVAFPDRFTAFSPLLEIRATDTLATLSDTVTLPGGGPTVTIEAWKLAAGAADLAAEVALLKTHLSTNQTDAGPYLHGNRFVVFFNVGGMEYDGGTTTGTGALKHETHHSWWGRGAKPASQNDAWWDEAWTVYRTESWPPLAFNAADPPRELHSQNQWNRATAGGAYTGGNRFFQGVAALTGNSALTTYMAEFYQASTARPTTTMAMEGHLLARSGREELVDSYHRWVYGFSGPASSPNLWLRDDPGHTGAELWEGRFWDSPDLWVRNRDDGGLAHQNPRAGRDNWFYARVRNQGPGSARHFMVTFAVKMFAGTQFVYPADFLPCIAATGGFDLSNGEVRILKAKWPAALVPPAGTHGCMLASVHARGNHPASGKHVWEENALAQKNLTILAAPAGKLVLLPVSIGHWTLAPGALQLELRRPKGFADLTAAVAFPAPLQDAGKAKSEALDCCAQLPATRRRAPKTPADAFVDALPAQPLPKGRTARFELKRDTGFPRLAGLQLTVPAKLKKGESVIVDLVQLDSKQRPVGGVAVMLVSEG